MYIVQVLITLLLFRSFESSLKCTKSEDCGWCGYCHEQTNESNSCYYPFSSFIYNENNDCQIRSHCKTENVCQNKGLCYDGFGYQIATCYCDVTKYYGEFCQKTIPKVLQSKLATGFGVFFSLDSESGFTSSPYSLYRILIYVTTIYSGEELKINVSTSEGFEVVLKESDESCHTLYTKLAPYGNLAPGCYNHEFCHVNLPDNCKELRVGTLDFCYKPPSANVFKLLEGDGVIAAGYLSKINVLATNFQTIVFNHTFLVMVNFNNLGYNIDAKVPEIQIKDCAIYPKYATLFLRSVEISFYFTTFNHVNWLQWLIYSMPTLEQVESYILTDWESSGLWTVPPFKLTAGKYKVRMLVSNVDKQMLSNFIDCYIEVKNENLIAHVEGGNRRLVGIEEGIFISGGKSYDPNEPLENQDHLSFLWTCSPKCSDIIQHSRKNMWVQPVNLTVGQTYRFTLTVLAPGVNPASASQEITVIGGESAISLHCLANCKDKVIPSEVLLLEVKTYLSTEVKSNFSWTYYVLDEGEERAHEVDSIYDDSYSSDLLCVKQNSLTPGKLYRFEVSYELLVASIKVKVDSKPYNGSCVVSPSNGILTKTLFNITCSGYIHEDHFLVYEFYNKHSTDPVENFNGRMLGTDFAGVLFDIKLTREIVAIFINSVYGTTTISIHKINLKKESDPTDIDINKNFTVVKMIAQTGRLDEALRGISGILDAVPENVSVNYIFSKSIDIIKISHIRPKTLSQMKIGLLTLKDIIFSFSPKSNISLQSSTVKFMTMYFRVLCEIFHGEVIGRSIPYITRLILNDVAMLTIDIIELILMITNGYLSSIGLSKMGEIGYRQYNDLGQTVKSIQHAINAFTYSVNFRQEQRLKDVSLESRSKLSSLTVLTDSCSKALSRANDNKKYSVKLPTNLITCSKEKDNTLTIQSTSLNAGPFLLQNFKTLSTNIVSLDIYKRVKNPNSYKTSMIPLKFSHLTTKPLNLYLDVKNTYEHGRISLSITQPHIKFVNEEDLDTIINVIRIDVPPRCKMFVKFILFNTSDKLRVKVTWALRPSYKLMMESSTIITSSHTTYEVPYEINDENQFMYIGVLPGPKVAIGDTVNFTIDLFCNTCLTLFRHSWVINFCSVGSETTLSNIQCQCNHLSFFSAVFIVPPKKINPFDNMNLLLTLKDNPYIALYIVIVLLAFSLLCTLAIIIDRRHLAAREVEYLDDNFPDDNFFYIIAVFTGCRFQASTNANVGIKITGTKGQSRAHILKARGKKVFRYNSDDWFLIGTSALLGTIIDVHIWHDSKGSGPDWYCEKILLYDINLMTVYTFFAEEWIALGDNQFPEAILFPATADDHRSLCRIFLENLRHGITHCHILSSILARHRDIKMTRLDRVVIIWTIVMTASLIGIAFYKASINEHDGIDDPHYSIGTKTFIKGTQIFFLNAFFIAFFQTIYKISYHLKDPERYTDYRVYERKNTRTYSILLSAEEQVYSVYLRPLKRSHMSSYEKFVQMIYKIYRPLTLLPVVLSRTSQVIEKKPIRYALAWICSVLTIVLSSYFIILYGLKMGVVKSKDWISHIGVAMINHFVILIPIKIVLVAVILASHFVNLVPISNYKIRLEDILNIKQHMRHDAVLKKRKSCFYHPMNTESTLEMKRERARRIFISEILTMIFVLIVVLILLVTYSLRVNYYHTNSHIKMMVQTNHDWHVINFIDVTNMTQFLNYLIDSFVYSDTFYRKKWYNQENLSPSYLQDVTFWTEDCSNQLIGLPVLRQLRVVPNTSCCVNKLFTNTIDECIPDWSLKVQDTDKYDYGWTTIQRKSEDFSSAWTFQTPSESEMPYTSSVTGKSYPTGGFVAALGATRQTSRVVLLRLIDGHWVDQYTRAIFCAFTLYNVNTHMFTQVSLMAEHLPIGLYLTKIQAESTELTFLEVVYSSVVILYVVLLILRAGIGLHSHGVKSFMSKIKNVFIIILILPGLFTVAFIVAHLYFSTAYISHFRKDDSAVIFHFYKIIKYQDIAHSLSILFFGALILRLFSLWSFGKLYLNVVATLKDMAPTLFKSCVCLILICIYHWNLSIFLNLFSFSRQDCVERWTLTLNSWDCFEAHVVNIIFYTIIRTILLLLLILISIEYRLVKYKSEKF